MKTNKQALFFAFLIISVYCWAGGNKEKDNNPQPQTQIQPVQQTVPQSTQPPAPQYWTGNGGSGISLGILVPESEGLSANLAYLPTMVQGVLVTNISRYSAISVLDRKSLDRVIKETHDPTYEDNLDIVRLGHVAHVGYMMTGKIIRTSTGYTLQINVTDTTPNARTIASYSSTATVAQLDDHTAIQIASRELLTQMGVQLTNRAITALSTTNSQQSINAQTTLAQGITAQRQGTVVEALTYYYQAKEFDPSLLEATNRASVLSTAITSGNIGENVRNDIQRRNEWVRILTEADNFFQNHLFEIVYDPNLIQGNINYGWGTARLSFWLSIIPTNSSLQALTDIRKGLIRTFKMTEWGFSYWPFGGSNYLDGQVARPFSSSKMFDRMSVHYGEKRYEIQAVLINENGKIIGRGSRRLEPQLLFPRVEDSYSYTLARVGISETSSIIYRHTNYEIPFNDVNANDITDNLTIQITSINGVNMQDPANQGYISIKTGTVDRSPWIRGYGNMY